VKVLTSLTLSSFLDLQKNELRNGVIQVLATPPSSPVTGQIYYNSDSNDGNVGLMVYNGTTWESVGSVDGLQGTAPIQVSVSGGIATISIDAADSDSAGSMSAAHYNLVNGATDANTASALVKRDADGDFAARDIDARMVIISGTTTNSTDVATKAYVDSVAQGLDVKQSVHVATTANLASLSGLLTIDGHTVEAGQRVLVKNQTTGSQNGIYVADSSTWSRADDFDGTPAVTTGAFVFVEYGNTQASSGWVLSTTGTITIGTTALTFTQFSASGSYAAGDGLTLTGNSFSVNVDDSTIELSAGDLRVKDNGITSAKMAAGSVELGTDTVTGTLAASNGGTGASTASDNYVFAGPVTGGPSAPSFRALVASDIPNHSTDKLTSGTLGVARGGTGASTFTAGIVKSTGSTNALTTESTVSLTTEVSGTLPVANGGTGATTLNSNGVLLGNGTSAVSATTAGSANQVLRVPGAGGAPAFGSINLASSDAVTGTLPVANGGTGGATAAAAKTSLGFVTRYSTLVGDPSNYAGGPRSTIPVTHNLNTRDIVVEVYEAASPYEKVYPDIKHTGVDSIDIVFASAPAEEAYKVVVIG
jgi:hypothetical protein